MFQCDPLLMIMHACETVVVWMMLKTLKRQKETLRIEGNNGNMKIGKYFHFSFGWGSTDTPDSKKNRSGLKHIF